MSSSLPKCDYCNSTMPERVLSINPKPHASLFSRRCSSAAARFQPRVGGVTGRLNRGLGAGGARANAKPGKIACAAVCRDLTGASNSLSLCFYVPLFNVSAMQHIGVFTMNKISLCLNSEPFRSCFLMTCLPLKTITWPSRTPLDGRPRRRRHTPRRSWIPRIPASCSSRVMFQLSLPIATLYQGYMYGVLSPSREREHPNAT